MQPSRRTLLKSVAAAALVGVGVGTAFRRPEGAPMTEADLILTNGRITTLDRTNPEVEALAIAGGRILAVGPAAEIMPLAGPGTSVVDRKSGRAAWRERGGQEVE